MFRNPAHIIVGLLLAVSLFILAGCGGGGGGGGGGSSPPPVTYTISGTISGYAGSGLVLKNNSTTLAVNAGGTTFSFSGVANSSTYSISVATPPSSPAQSCSVINGNGTVNGANVTNVQVNCITNTYKISGSVTGLSGTGLVLQNNGADDLLVNSSNFTFSSPVANGGPYAVTVLAQPSGQSCSVINGSGTVATTDITDVQVSCVTNTPPPPTNYTIGGTISGLTGAGLVLRNNGSDNLAPNPNSATTAFTFNTAIANGNPYNVTVSTQPVGQSCSVTNGSGTVAGANITNVQVTCTDIPTYTIGGTISGLTGTGLVLQNNGGNNRSISTNGAFNFSTALVNGSSYNVSVLAQPSGQTCSVTNSGGTVASANVTNVQVNCLTNTYTISGNVSGLTGSGLVLQNNGGNNITISVNGAFTFSSAIASGNTYSVTVLTQPNGQTCGVTNGNGTVVSAPITNVQVNCTNNPSYTIGGTISGLAGTGLVLQNNGGDNRTIAASDTLFTFPTAIKSGNPYSVTVLTQPVGQTCSITSGNGTVASANITNVQVNCITNSYTISGSVSGLTDSGLVLQNNLSDNRSISVNGVFAFNTAIASGNVYSVTVLTQPIGQTCSVANGSGTVSSSNVNNVQVSCINNTYTVSGNVTGPLNGDPLPGTLIMQNNGADNLSVSGYGFFTFPIAVAHGNPYNVTILQQPDSVWSCIPYHSTGIINSANVSDVQVSCIGNATLATGSMTTSRRAHSATRLTDGRVLVTGGWNTNRDIPLASAVVYDQAADSGIGAFVATAPLSNARTGHTATALANGNVLITGGEDKNNSGNLSSAEIFDPALNAGLGGFNTTGSMNTVRVYHVAALLTDGTVLIAGGYGGSGSTIASAEIYDTNSGTFSYTTGPMSWNRIYHTATLLNNGTVLIAGGQGGLPFAEIYNPGTKTFSTTGVMSASRHRHTATLLSDGKVLIVGGAQDAEFGNPIASAEVYDPATGTFRPTGSMSNPRADHTANLLANGKVLITGGRSINSDSGALTTTEIYDPASGLFTNAGAMGSARTDHSATLLLSPADKPRVLISGGFNGSAAVGTAELFVPQ